MDKKKIFKIIGIIAAVVIIIFFVAKSINSHKQLKMQDGSKTTDDPYKGDELELQGTVYEEGTRSNYMMLKSAIEKYFTYCRELNAGEYPIDKEEIYSLFAKEFISEYNINDSNISEFISKIDATSIRMDKILSTSFVDGNATTYIVSGEAMNENELTSQKFDFIVVVDYETDNFALLLDKYYHDKGYDSVKPGDVITAITNSIDGNNKINYEYVTDNDFISEIYKDFKNDSIFFTERAYNHLSDECKNSRFSSLEAYKSYIDLNKKDIYLSSISSFMVKNDVENNVTTYRCIDSLENEIVFNFYSLTNYDVTIK